MGEITAPETCNPCPLVLHGRHHDRTTRLWPRPLSHCQAGVRGERAEAERQELGGLLTSERHFVGDGYAVQSQSSRASRRRVWVRPAGPGVVDGALDGSLGISTDLLTVTPALLMGIAMLGARGRQKRPVVGAEKSPPRALADPRHPGPGGRPPPSGWVANPRWLRSDATYGCSYGFPFPAVVGKAGRRYSARMTGTPVSNELISPSTRNGKWDMCVCMRALEVSS